MKKVFLIISTLLFITLACNGVLPAKQPAVPTPVIPTLTQLQGESGLPLTEDDVPRVTVEEAKLALGNGEAVIVDVRSAEFYTQSHVAGAISIPLDKIELDLASVPLDKNIWIITYCT